MLDKFKSKAQEMFGKEKEHNDKNENETNIQFIVPPGVAAAEAEKKESEAVDSKAENIEKAAEVSIEEIEITQPAFEEHEVEIMDIEPQVISLEELEEKPAVKIDVIEETLEEAAREGDTAPLGALDQHANEKEMSHDTVPLGVLEETFESRAVPQMSFVSEEEGYDFDASQTDLSELAREIEAVVGRPGHELSFAENKEATEPEVVIPDFEEGVIEVDTKDLIEKRAAEAEKKESEKIEEYAPLKALYGAETLNAETNNEPANIPSNYEEEHAGAEKREMTTQDALDILLAGKSTKEVSFEMPYTETGFLTPLESEGFGYTINVREILGVDAPKEEAETKIEKVVTKTKREKPSWIPSRLWK